MSQQPLLWASLLLLISIATSPALAQGHVSHRRLLQSTPNASPSAQLTPAAIATTAPAPPSTPTTQPTPASTLAAGTPTPSTTSSMTSSPTPYTSPSVTPGTSGTPTPTPTPNSTSEPTSTATPAATTEGVPGPGPDSGDDSGGTGGSDDGSDGSGDDSGGDDGDDGGDDDSGDDSGDDNGDDGSDDSGDDGSDDDSDDSGGDDSTDSGDNGSDDSGDDGSDDGSSDDSSENTGDEDDASSGTSAQDLLISLNQTLPIATFLSVLDQTDLLAQLKDPSLNLTIFAPSDEAFEEAAASWGLTLDEFENGASILPVLLNQIVPGSYLAADLASIGKVTTELGEVINIITLPDQTISLIAANSTANVTSPDNCLSETCNVVVHGTDGLLLPQVIYTDGQTFVVGDGQGGQLSFTVAGDATPLDLSTGLAYMASQGSVMTFSIPA